MSITGIAEITYGVEDLENSIGFFEDFGLSKLDSSNDHAVFEVVSGQRVNLYRMGDSRVPQSGLVGPGVHECVWAVPGQADLDALVRGLSRDHEVVTDASGTAHFVTAFGQAIGLKVFQPRAFTCAPSPANAPGIVNRLNTPRKWPTRAIPKTISHIVWGFMDVNETLAFYRDRLGFKITDFQKGVGVYIRAGRSTNHHSIMVADANSGAFGFNGVFRFDHVNFGVEDFDELMAGKNYLERRGHKDKGWGMGRHRVSSELFLYLPSPAGGEVEYGADCDQVDDQWRPRVWGANFAAFTFMHNMPEWYRDYEPDWDVSYACADTVYQPPAH